MELNKRHIAPMRCRQLNPVLDIAGEQPLFLQLASAITEASRCTHLQAGEPLPGICELAEHLGVNRNNGDRGLRRSGG